MSETTVFTPCPICQTPEICEAEDCTHGYHTRRSQTTRGGYYLNSLKTWRNELLRDLQLGDARMVRLDRSGNSCAEDHRAAMSVRREMLAVVDRALKEQGL